MKSIAELRQQIEEEIAAISYPTSPNDLYSPIDYILALGGKRMRPILLLLAHQLYNSNIQSALKAALAVEVFHNFTLLHDDIMDNAPLRRGQKTVHEKWNTNIAILSGDTMLVQAYQYVSQVPEPVLNKVLSVFSKTAVEVCEGQQWDMEFENRVDVSVSEYLKMIEFKTAVLLAGALKMGALIGGANETQAQHLYEFGRNMGMAFQLKDDLLDVFGDKEKFGKQVGGDILSNKKTYLYLQSLALSEGTQKESLQYWFSSKKHNDQEKVNAVKSIYTELKIPDLTKALMHKYHDTALAHLGVIEGDKRGLKQFANSLLEREN